MGETTKQIRVVKCPCGDEVCNRYGFSDGIFPQGAGWPEEIAQRHLRAVNAHDALVATLKKARHQINFLNSGPKGRALLDEMDAALALVEEKQ